METPTDSIRTKSAKDLAVGCMQLNIWHAGIFILHACTHVRFIPCKTMETVCNQKPDSGLCNAFMPRYFYNSASGKCESFVYGGCGGNANRFKTLDECTRGCGECYIF